MPAEKQELQVQEHQNDIKDAAISKNLEKKDVEIKDKD